MKKPVYLDYNATAPLDPRVFEAMTPWFTNEWGNAGSRTHVYGHSARKATDQAREQVASLLNADPTEIVFTSGATESNNLAILGVALPHLDSKRRHILSSKIEHKAVLEPLEYLAGHGFEVELLPVSMGGRIESDEVAERLRDDTILVSVMHANNETGVLQPIQEVSELLLDHPALFHVDAAQSFGKEVDSLHSVHCDLLSISAHKFYGPKGIGALYVRQSTSLGKLAPILFGGGQERGLRPGTLPVPLAVGLGKASELAGGEYDSRRQDAAKIKARLLEDLSEIDFTINGDQHYCQTHVANISFPGVDSEALMMFLRPEIAVSNGSACTSATYSPSHVLSAMGLDEGTIDSSVRLSWGPGIDYIEASSIIRAVQHLNM